MDFKQIFEQNSSSYFKQGNTDWKIRPARVSQRNDLFSFVFGTLPMEKVKCIRCMI